MRCLHTKHHSDLSSEYLLHVRGPQAPSNDVCPREGYVIRGRFHRPTQGTTRKLQRSKNVPRKVTQLATKIEQNRELSPLPSQEQIKIQSTKNKFRSQLSPLTSSEQVQETQANVKGQQRQKGRESNEKKRHVAQATVTPYQRSTSRKPTPKINVSRQTKIRHEYVPKY